MHVYPLSIKWEEKLFSAVDPPNEKKEKKTWRTSQGAVFHDRSHHKGKVCPIASVKKTQNKLKTSHMVQQIYLNQLKQFQKKEKQLLIQLKTNNMYANIRQTVWWSHWGAKTCSVRAKQAWQIKWIQKGAKIAWNARSNSQNKLAKYWWPQPKLWFFQQEAGY